MFTRRSRSSDALKKSFRPRNLLTPLYTPPMVSCRWTIPPSSPRKFGADDGRLFKTLIKDCVGEESESSSYPILADPTKAAPLEADEFPPPVWKYCLAASQYVVKSMH